MRKLFNLFQKKIPLLLILIAGLVPLLWFKNNLLIAGGDFPIPLNPTGNFFKSFFYTWYPYLYGGEPNPQQFAIIPWFGFWSLLRTIGFSLLTINKLWFVSVFTLSGLSTYYLVSVIGGKKPNGVFLFIAPLFYMFNLFILVVTPVMATPLLYSVLPLLLGLYIKGLEEKENSAKYVILIPLVYFLISSVIGNPPIYAISGILLFSYYLFYLFTHSKKDILPGLYFNLKIIVLYLLLNIWWIYPFIINVLYSSGDFAKRVVDIGFLGSFLSENFRLLGSWAFFENEKGIAYFPFAHYYKTPIFIILTFIIPILAFISAFFKPKKIIYYFLFMALFGILLANGSGVALIINKIFFLIPGFWIFREPFAKFTAITTLSYAILIGFSVSKLFYLIRLRLHQLYSKIFLVCVLCIILITSWPILTGDLIFSERGWMKSNHVQIPEYWFTASKWFNNLKEDFRILVLPENPKSFYSGLPYEWGYGSADIAPYMIQQPLIEENAGFGSSNSVELSTKLAKSIYNKINSSNVKGDSLIQLFRILNIRYVLQKNDIDWKILSMYSPTKASPDYFKKVLSSIPYLNKKISFGSLDVYQFSENFSLPHFYIPENIVYSNADITDLVNIYQNENLSSRSAFYISENNAYLFKPDEVILKSELLDRITNNETGADPKHDFAKSTYSITAPSDGEYDFSIYDSGRIIPLGKKSIQKGLQQVSLPMNRISDNLLNDKLQIVNYTPETIYRISLEFKTSGNSVLYFNENNSNRELFKIQLFPAKDNNYQQFEGFFKSSSEGFGAAINFVNGTNLEYKNLQVNRIYEPSLIIKSVNKIETPETKKAIPKITFVKINPTKYRVKVEGAKDPYSLIFSESFNKGWKLYINELTDSEINGLKKYGEIVTSYFNGEIKEGTPRMNFLEPDTFETWGKLSLSEEKHLLVNGYANSWYITPEDTGEKQDYEIIIEFTPQRIFFLSIIISGLTLIGCLGCIIFIYFKKKWNKN